MKSTVEKFGNEIFQSTENQEQDRRKLKELLEDNDRKIKEVEKNLQHKKQNVKKRELFKCEECGVKFDKK